MINIYHEEHEVKTINLPSCIFGFFVVNKKLKIDELVKSRKTALSVIPADPGSSPGGIQSVRALTKTLDSGFHRSDDFLRDRQN